MRYVGQGWQVAQFSLYIGLGLWLNLCLNSGTARAQAPHATEGERFPGIRHEGRFLGYQPPHLARQAPPASEPEPRIAVTGVPDATSRGAPATKGGTAAQPVSARRTTDQVVHPSSGHSASGAHHHESHSRHAVEASPLLRMIGWSESAHFDHSHPHVGAEVVHDCPETFYCPPHQDSLLWGRAEYLLWWTRGMKTPPLATTSTSPNTPRPQAGVVGFPDTEVLFGDSPLMESSQSGARFMLGSWLDNDQTLGLEVTYLYVGEGSDRFHGSAGDFPILARPFRDAQTSNQASQLINYPGFVQGELDIEALTQFQSLEALVRHPAHRSATSQIDYLIGYRYARLEDQLNFHSNSTALSGPTQGAQIDLSDRFGSHNRFHGVELGLAYVGRPTPLWEAEMVAKVALGRTLSQFDIQGESTTTTAGGTATSAAGLLAQPSNSGVFDSSRFGAMAEFGVNLRRDLPGGFQATVGYTFIHWGSVLRAHDQIDPAVNQAQVPTANPPGELRPMAPSNKSSYWAQGLNFGLSYDF
jgi:hypothetical protein